MYLLQVSEILVHMFTINLRGHKVAMVVILGQRPRRSGQFLTNELN